MEKVRRNPDSKRTLWPTDCREMLLCRCDCFSPIDSLQGPQLLLLTLLALAGIEDVSEPLLKEIKTSGLSAARDNPDRVFQDSGIVGSKPLKKQSSG